MITEDEDKENATEQMGNQEMNIEKNWHGSQTSSTQLKMILRLNQNQPDNWNGILSADGPRMNH